MKIKNKLTALLFLSALGISVAAMSDTTESDIRITINTLESALNGSNLKELSALYTEDATVILVEDDVLDDNNEIIKFWDNELNSTKSNYHIDVIDFQVNKNVAYISALWSATVIVGSNVEVRDGYLTSYLSRQLDGRWKIHAQNWN